MTFGAFLGAITSTMAREPLKRPERANGRYSRAASFLSSAVQGKVYYNKSYSVMGFGRCRIVNGTRVVEVMLRTALRGASA